jgi:hypothetical protein
VRYARAASVAALVLIAATTACAGADVRPSSPPAITQQPIVQPSSESAPAIPDLATLTRQAELVVVGRVAAPGTTRQDAQPAQTPIGPTIGPTRTGQGQPPPGGAGISIPITTYIVDVEREARGAPLPGARITVTQSGNPIRGAPPSADDVPMAAGERYVLFLRSAADGTFFVVGGIQGRLLVDAQGNVHPVGSGSPATRSHDGQSLDAFLTEVRAIK